MLRIISALSVALSLSIASGAEACSCPVYLTKEDRDLAGEQVWQIADVVVEATIGDVPSVYKSMCPAVGIKPNAADIGREMTADRPLKVHKVFKGQISRSAVVQGQSIKVYEYGCRLSYECGSIGMGPNIRTILVLQRLKDGRFRASDCALQLLRDSERGRALFAQK